MRNFGLFTFVLLTLSACASFAKRDETLEGSWQLQDINNTSQKSSFENEAAMMKTVSDGSLLSLFPDKTFTEISGNGTYFHGEWEKYASDKISFHSAKGKEFLALKWKPNLNHPSQLVFKSKAVELIYSKAASRLENYLDDPYHIANNLWRMKPVKAESNEAIKSRLANYFKHFALILKAAKERKDNVVYFGFSSGPIQIYSGAIGILPYDKVSKDWKNTFHNEADAATAYLIFKNLLAKSNYKGSSAGNWVEDDYNIVLSLYNTLKNEKE
jgi:hypothetical protein